MSAIMNRSVERTRVNQPSASSVTAFEARRVTPRAASPSRPAAKIAKVNIRLAHIAHPLRRRSGIRNALGRNAKGRGKLRHRVCGDGMGDDLHGVRLQLTAEDGGAIR